MRDAGHYLPIADYGLIGDMHSCALVSKTGSIDWCCLPSFDSPSTCGRLLDWRRGGYFQVAPRGIQSISRRYLPRTNVLETTFTTVAGVAQLTEAAKTHFKGSGNVAYGRIGDDPYAYIATVEPFHGNTVAVYHKETPGLLSEARWKRTVLDVYADPNESGEGPGHHVVCADFDGDGDDEFLVALRGPVPWQGVFYYKAIDAVNGLWVKTRVSTASAARIAVAYFNGDGRLDFATTGYYTPGYFLCDDPRVMVYLNTFGAEPR